MSERIPIDAPTRSFSGRTNAYILGSDDALLVDPADLTAAVESALAERTVDHVAVTHHHPDHVGGVAAAADAFDLTVWALASRAGAFEVATGIAPDRCFRPGEGIGSEGIRVIDTPGHAPEHVAFATEGTLVTGDLVVERGSVVVGAPDGDMRAYLSSLRRLHARGPDRFLPGHGPVVDAPRETCARLIDHRLERESLVRVAVEEGHETPRDIVDEVYEKDVSAVYELATATVVAHLEKLAVEGYVTWDGERARPA